MSEYGADRTIDFVCVGPQRTASSWLDRALRQHPRLVLPSNVKETFFFDRYFERGWTWYRQCFVEVEPGQQVGEVGTTYFGSDAARERIRQANPDVRVIIMVRNPVARSVSAFRHEYSKGRAPGDLLSAVRENPEIVERGRYARLAPRWEEAFSPERVRYVLQEDIERAPQAQFDVVCDFLGVERCTLPERLCGRHNEGRLPRYPRLAAVATAIASGLRHRGLHRVVELAKRTGLKAVYTGGEREQSGVQQPEFEYLMAAHYPDIAFLERRLGRSFPHWREPPWSAPQ